MLISAYLIRPSAVLMLTPVMSAISLKLIPLATYDYILNIVICQPLRVEEISLIIIIEDNPHLLLMPEVINNKVVSNPHHPGDKLAVVLVTARAY